MRFIPAIFFTTLLGCSALSWTADPVQAATPNWTLPKTISDENITVTFEVDSTWHMIHGSTKGITGTIWMEEPTDPTSLHGTLHFPVAQFDTENSSRDDRLREIMAADKFSDVIYEFSKLTGECEPRRASSTQGCEGVLVGELTIRGLTREARVPIHIAPANGALKVSGEFPFEWSAFGVEDPSIFVAKLAPVVKVSFQVTLPKQNYTESE